MPLTSLRPDYYDAFPNLTLEEVTERLRTLPFHLSTLLGVKNILRAAATPSVKERFQEFLASDAEVQRSQLGRVLENAGISGTVVSAAMRIPREAFVLPKYRRYCYLNHFIPFSRNSCVSAPGLVALMVEHLQPTPTDRILEIGIGSGIHAAWISELVENRCEILGIERNAEYAAIGRRTLSAMRYQNIAVKTGDGADPTQDFGLFSKIYLTAASLNPPHPVLLNRLKDGGNIQFVRGVSRQEFESDRSDSWLRRTYPSYESYLDGEWRSYCCLATARKEGNALIETSQVYDVTFVPIGQGIIEEEVQPENPFVELMRLAEEH